MSMVKGLLSISILLKVTTTKLSRTSQYPDCQSCLLLRGCGFAETMLIFPSC
uniref:Uncharacterized protein n=1 Tax=Brassica campestris TaxID=3711 RepID=A0A3P6AWZ6_BRACM|nr:unnamed protein product [Brassica rapa]